MDLHAILDIDYSKIQIKNLTSKERRIFNEWSNPVRVNQEPNRGKARRMRKRAYYIYLRNKQQ